jgi:glycosyltransferase involved in cell wall biosynthesis
MKNPIFSVVIPLYNKEKYILKTVNSVLNQSFKDFEIIIVNDGSTDNSLAKAKEIVDDRIRIVSQVNSGPGAARNRGIKESNGTWISFIDADDEYANDYLHEVFNTAEEIKEAEVIYSLCYLKTNKNYYIPKVGFSKPKVINYFEFTNKFYKEKTIENSLLFMHSSCVSVRKNAFIKSGYFLEEVSIGEDTDTWYRLAWTCKIVLIPKILATYNIDDGSSDHTNKTDFRLRLKTFSYWKNNNLIPSHLLKDSFEYINYYILWESYRLAVKGKKIKSANLLIKNLFLINTDILLFLKVLIVIVFPRKIINTVKSYIKII